MSTIIAIMDRAGFEANTDVLVLVQPEHERLLWIPRDVWCDTLSDRVNVAYQRGGHALLAAALAEHGLTADCSLVLSRAATEAALADVTVVVPVPVRMTFDYPLTPTTPIELGRKQIEFRPLAEQLSGERIHQWIGARGGSDLHRIERQKVLLRRLLEKQFDFARALATPEWLRCSDPQAYDNLRQVRATWHFDTLGGLRPDTRDGKQVLLREA